MYKEVARGRQDEAIEKIAAAAGAKVRRDTQTTDRSH
jgi:hypothetical protein